MRPLSTDPTPKSVRAWESEVAPRGPPWPPEQWEYNTMIEDSLIYNSSKFHDDYLKRVCFVRTHFDV